MQFIETAKEISHLESEMYQLSQLLSEQRSLLGTLGSSRSAAGVIFDDTLESQNEDPSNAVSKEEEQKQKLVQLLENVEGAMVKFAKSINKISRILWKLILERP